jgi:hypothetical protein
MNTNSDFLRDSPEDGSVDSLGIRYYGPILEGLVTPVDALLLYSPRGNPLDPFNLAEGLLEGRL